MLLKLISGLLILLTTVMSVRHGWAGLSGRVNPEQASLMAGLGITKPILWVIAVLTVAVGLLVLFPRTFFVGNLLGASLFLVIIAFALDSGNFRAALIELPFLMIPLLLIWLGHPLKS